MKIFVQILYIFTRVITYTIIPVLAIFLLTKYTSGFIVYAIFSFILIATNFFVFSKYTLRYPLNNLDGYEIKLIVNKFDFIDDVLTINFANEKGVYKTINGRTNIVINLTNYPFPEAYIEAFIIRQIRYSDIGANFSISNLYKSRYASKKYINLLVNIQIYESNNTIKRRKFYAVRNNNHVSKWLINDINRAPFCDNFIIWRTQKELYEKIHSYDEGRYRQK